MERLQLRVLYRVFLLRVIDLDTLSPDGDPTKLLGQIAAIFVSISFFACVPLITVGGRLDENTRWNVEFFFLAATMLAIGLFSVLNWDSIFPDKRDLLVLGPLPVVPRTILIAKLAALAYALGLLVLALNVFIGIIWPAVFCSTESFLGFVRSYAAYWITILASSAFMFFSVLTAQGIASQLLPRQIYLRVSAPIQVMAFALLLGAFILEPGDVTEGALRSPAIHWLPAYWFFGLSQRIRGGSGPMQAVFANLAREAWIALGIVLTGAVGTLLAFYLRKLGKIVQSPDILPARRRWGLSRAAGNSLRGLLTLFSLRVLLRSRQHRIILSFYYGVGFAIVMAYAFAWVAGQSASRGPASTLVGPPLLIVSLLMMCITVGGIRIVVPMPITLPANWIFRITELHAPSSYLNATRWSFITLGVVPAWLTSSALFFSLWPWRLACGHLFVLAVFGTSLAELFLLGFAKIPFTCSYLPGKGKIQFAFWACVMLLGPSINEAADIEMRTLGHPSAYGLLIAALLAVLGGTRWINGAAMRRMKSMRFDEKEAPVLVSLGLDRK